MILVRQSLVCVLGIVILATPAHADLIAYEWFDYSAGGDLLQKDGGLGFSGEWIQYDVAPILDGWKVVEGSLTFPRLLSFGNSVTTEAYFDDNWVGLLREFDGVTDDTTTKYMSLLMRPEGVVDEGAFGGAFGIG